MEAEGSFDRRTFLKTALLLGAVAVGLQPASGRVGYFTPRSFWNKPLPASDVPIDGDSERYLAWLAANASRIRLAGLGSDQWGGPFVVSQPTDPVWTVRIAREWRQNEIVRARGLRIPAWAVALLGRTSDSQIVVVDPDSGFEASLWRARPADLGARVLDCATCGVYWLASNGLQRGDETPDGEIRNRGHRGIPGYAFQFLRSELDRPDAGHVLKVAIPGTAEWHVRPMVDHERGRGGIIGEGIRLRIRGSIDVDDLPIPSSALPIARTLQRYGAIVGDNTQTDAIVLKCEQNVGQWDDTGLHPDSLSTITPDMLEFVERGWEPD